jgi:hypothetical protein
MKKLVAFLSLLGIAIAAEINISAQTTNIENKEFVQSGKLFGQIFANVHTNFTDNKSLTSFEITRSFFGYDYSFSKTFSGRIIYDATAISVNNKMIYQGYLRNVYLQYDNGKLNIKGGLITPEQIIVGVRMWNYLFIGRPFLDYNGMTFTSDLGISAKYSPSKMLAVDFSITNGHGFKNIAPDSTFRYSAGITFLPTPDFILRGYYDVMNEQQAAQTTMGLSGAYVTERLTVGAEYVLQNCHLNTKDHDYSGFSVFARIRMSEKLFFFARYDDLSSATIAGSSDAWNLSRDGGNIYSGIEYVPVKGIRLAPNVGFIIPDDNAVKKTVMIGLNTEIKF